MILRTPNNIPPHDEDEDNNKEEETNSEPPLLEKISMAVGSFIVDAIFQTGLSFWWVWVIFNITGRQIDQLLWSLGMTILYSALHLQSPQLSGAVFAKTLQCLILVTLGIWIFK